MQREPENISRMVQDPAWKRIERLLPEASGTDPAAAAILVLGLAAVMAVSAVTL